MKKNPMGSENLAKNTTPSIPNYKSFQESWRVKPFQSLTKITERNTKIYDITMKIQLTKNLMNLIGIINIIIFYINLVKLEKLGLFKIFGMT